MKKYKAHYFEDGKYIGVEFPDLPGVFSQADTLQHAHLAAKKALDCFFDRGDNSHVKLCNPQSKKVVVFPVDVAFLGDILRDKILNVAVTEVCNAEGR